jgi:2-dehydro-3-deoxyphosphogluconate aldolase/(4S)-4-hydroxy-2-oxoglutarate aldolase
MTPTEAQAAAGLGADLVKLFPADVLGLEYYKAIIAPLKHIRFVPTGGITTENMADYLRLGAAGFGIGSNLINAKQVKEGRFDLVEASARAFCQAAGQ